MGTADSAPTHQTTVTAMGRLVASLLSCYDAVIVGRPLMSVALESAQIMLMAIITPPSSRFIDLRVRSFAGAEQADPGMVGVVIDQPSLDVIVAPRTRDGLEQEWRWPRERWDEHSRGPASDPPVGRRNADRFAAAVPVRGASAR